MAWKHLRHPNILPLIGATVRDHELRLISEWVDQGDITDYVSRKENLEVNRIELVSRGPLSPVRDPILQAVCDLLFS